MTPLPPAGARYATYERFSTTNQNFRSIEDQRERNDRFGAQQGWNWSGDFYDAAKSGTTIIGRNGLYEMMAAADRGEFDVLVIEDLDRLSRNAGDTHKLVEELNELGVAICTVAGGGIASDTEVGFKAVQNAEYVKVNTYKSKRGMEGAIGRGQLPGRIPFGYEKVTRTDELRGFRKVVPSQAVIVNQIFEDTLAGLTPFDICAALNREGIPGPGGRPWRPGLLVGGKAKSGGLLRNAHYVCKYRYRKTANKKRRGKTVSAVQPTPTWIVQELPDELRIVSDELFGAVQALLDAKVGRKFYSQQRSAYLLSGKSKCGWCGRPAIVRSGRLSCTGKHEMGICSNRMRVPRDQLESTVLQGAKERLLNSSIIASVVAAYRQEAEAAAAESRTRVESSQQRLVSVERRIDNLVAELGGGGLDQFALRAVRQALGPLEAERQALQADLALRVELPDLADTPTIVARITSIIEGLERELESDDRESVRARDLIRSMVDSITITPDPGPALDGRGSGPVRVTVQGRLSEILRLGDLSMSRDAKKPSHPESALDVTATHYSFYVDFIPDNGRLATVYRDLAVFSRLLDDADAPVTRAEGLAALARAESLADSAEDDGLGKRLRQVQCYLFSRGLARSIRLGPNLTGWVWNHVPRSDLDWRERALRQRPAGYPLPVIRTTPPQAHVVVVGPPTSTQDEDDLKVEGGA